MRFTPDGLERLADTLGCVFPVAGKVPATGGESWQAEPADGWNWQAAGVTGYGYAIPHTRVVFDIDVAPAGAIADELRLPYDTLRVRTGKGLHVYLAADPETISLLPGKLMLHGMHLGEVKRHGGYVVGPGSRHPTGCDYEVDGNHGATLDDIAELLRDGIAPMPDRVAELLAPTRQERQRDTSGSNGHRHDYTPEQYADALMAIPTPSDYGDWLRISMAAHRAGIHYPIWDRWSQRGDGYNAAGNRASWDSFGKPSPGTPITAGTLIHEARKHGWVGAPNKASESGVRKYRQHSDWALSTVEIAGRRAAVKALRGAQRTPSAPRKPAPTPAPHPQPPAAERTALAPLAAPLTPDAATIAWRAEAAQRIAAGVPVPNPGDDF